MRNYFANLTPLHRRSWMLVVGYVAALIVLSWVDFGYDTAGQTIFRGIYIGMLIFMVASGLSLIFGLLDVLNFAQGAFVLIGAYVGWEVHDSLDIPANLRFLTALVSAVFCMSVMGAIFEIALIRPLYERPVFQIVLTFGLGAVLLDLIERRYGLPPKSFDYPPLLDGQVSALGQTFSTYRLFIIALGLLMMISVYLLLNRTRIGIIIRAGVQDAEMVQALGINVRRVFTLVFVIGAALAAVGGVALVPTESANLDLGSKYLILAIVVIVIGGMGSYEGTAIASLVVGLTRAVADQLALRHLDTTALGEMSVLFLMIAVLLIQPSGLFGRETA